MKEQGLSRRALLGTALGLSATGTGLALVGLREPFRPHPTPEVVPYATPEPLATPANRIQVASDNSLVLEMAPDILLNAREVNQIAAVKEDLAVFEPADTVSLAHIEPLWSVVGSHITFSPELFENTPEALNRQEVEIPYAFFLSTLTKAFAEGTDGKRIKAIGQFMDVYDLERIAELEEPAIEGRELYNPYRNTYPHMTEEVEEYDVRMRDPLGYFPAVATSLYTNLHGIDMQIMGMPKEMQSYSEGMGNYPESYTEQDSPQRRVAKQSFDATYQLLKALTVPHGMSAGAGRTSTGVNRVIPGLSTTYVGIGLWNA